MDIRLGAVQEADIVYSGTGHNHSGGANGGQLDWDLALIDAIHKHISAAEGSTLGLDALKVDEQSAQTTGAVTVSAGGISVVTLPSMTVAVGDRIIVSGNAIFTKGIAAGRSIISLTKLSGAATIEWFNNLPLVEQTVYQEANLDYNLHINGIAKVTGGGAIIIHMFGTSLGSSASVGYGVGQIYALVLRGTG